MALRVDKNSVRAILLKMFPFWRLAEGRGTMDECLTIQSIPEVAHRTSSGRNLNNQSSVLIIYIAKPFKRFVGFANVIV